MVLPHSYRDACALVDELRSDYQQKSDGCFALLSYLDADSDAYKIARDFRDEAEDKFRRFAKVLERLRP